MSESFFGLLRQPFPAVADPGAIFETCGSRAARQAIDGLVARWIGLIILEAEAGVGKTEFLRAYRRNVDPDTVLMLTLGPGEVDLARIGKAMGELLQGPFKPPPDLARLDAMLLERRRAGRATVLAIDDAQALSKSAWPVLDRLAMLGSPAEPAVTILLAGRPPFSAALADGKRTALRQRTTAKVSLRPLSPAEASEFLYDRLLRAGATEVGKIIGPDLVERLVAASAGVPGRLVALGAAVLDAGAAKGEHPVTPHSAEQAIGLAQRPPRPQARIAWSRRLAIAAGICLAAIIGWRMLNAGQPSDLSSALRAPVSPARAAIPAAARPAPPLPRTAAPSVQQASARPLQDYYPVDVFLLPAARGDTLRRLYDVAYRNRSTRPSFDQFREANPGLAADQRLAADELVAFPGPLGANWH